MQIDTLHAELERLFDLETLIDLAQNTMGFDPNRVGGIAAVGSFARALASYCVEQDAVEALCDAVRILRPHASLELDNVRARGISDDAPLTAGQNFAGIEIVRTVGEGRYGQVYQGRYAERSIRVKVLNRVALRDRRGLHRLSTFARLSRRIANPALAANVEILEDSGKVAIICDWAEGQTLRSRIDRTGPMHLAEARSTLERLLDALIMLHEARLVHGAIHLDNILLGHDSSGSSAPVLLDGGMDRIGIAAQQVLPASSISPLLRYIAPELLAGNIATPATDVYALGVAIYEMVTGKRPFEFEGVDALYAHLRAAAPPPSSLAPRGWVTRDVDDFVASLLAKDPQQRPSNAQALMVRLQALDLGTSAYRVSLIPEAEIDSRIESLLTEPGNADYAAALDSAVDSGADPARVADALFMAATSIPAHDYANFGARQNLLLRAAGLFEHAVRNLDKAEQVYAMALETDPGDDKTAAAMERVLRGLGKFEELIEVLLQRGQQAETRTERGRAFAEIGRIYLQELGDLDQALVAYTQALCEDVEKDQYAEEIERLAGSRHQAWLEVLEACNSPLQDDSLQAESKNALLVRVGRWYSEKASRPDMASQCFQAVIATDPANEAALEALAQIYRKS